MLVTEFQVERKKLSKVELICFSFFVSNGGVVDHDVSAFVVGCGTFQKVRVVCILLIVKLKWTIVALTMLSPAKNDAAFCLFRVCVGCLLKINWTTFLYSSESSLNFDSSEN